jgi:tRNA 2-thiouridine synthesizing protein E
MTTATYGGVTVELDEGGFLADPGVWTREIAADIAAAEGITALTDRHWLVVDVAREQYLRTGSGPAVRQLGKASGVGVKELYALFPGGPAMTAARIAGIPKPRGCI